MSPSGSHWGCAPVIQTFGLAGGLPHKTRFFWKWRIPDPQRRLFARSAAAPKSTNHGAAGCGHLYAGSKMQSARVTRARQMKPSSWRNRSWWRPRSKICCQKIQHRAGFRAFPPASRRWALRVSTLTPQRPHRFFASAWIWAAAWPHNPESAFFSVSVALR